MKKLCTVAVLTVVCLLVVAGVVMISPTQHVSAQQIGDQQLLKLRFANNGIPGQGAGILQTGEVSKVSSAVATATLTQAAAAPVTSSQSTYIRGIVVEKSTGSSGTFTIQTGTGTNCGTSTTVLLGPVTNPPIQLYYLGIVAPPGTAVCIQTDAVTTSVRVLYS